MSNNPLSTLSKDQLEALLETLRKTQAKPLVASSNKPMEAVCIEHDTVLVDGRCFHCRDAEGSTFVLDMQSYYLRPKDKPSAPARSYYKVSNGYFVTVLDPRDVSDMSPEAIKKAACEPLQPWFMSDEWSDIFGYTLITRNEYIDWLRR
jgi:hypothetical protein